MSSALPAGGPSKMSVSTTSASSMSTMRCAVVDPTNPPPTTVTFLRIPSLSSFVSTILCASSFAFFCCFAIYRATACAAMFSIIAEANAEVPNLVAPLIIRSKS